MNGNGTRALESRIGQIGREIFARARRAEPSPLRIAWWQRQLLDWVMRDESLKVQLFRFIESLPQLRSPRAVASHLRQYLRDGYVGEHGLPLAVDFVTAFTSDASWTARAAAFAANFGAMQMAAQFIAGSTMPQASAAVQRLRRRRMTFTLDVLGEAVICSDDAAAYQRLYLDLIDAMTEAAPAWPNEPMLDESPYGPLPRVNLSIKLSALAARFDPIAPERVIETVIGRLRPVLEKARRRGVFVNIDIEHYSVKDLTFDIFMRVMSLPDFRDWPDVGVVVQTYLRESETDLLRLLDWTRRRGAPITVRLVKGAYWDHETALARARRWPVPVWTEKWQSDRQFEKLAAIMLDNHEVLRPAFASHNVRSLAAVLAMAQQRRLAPRTLEVQMLYGMGEPLMTALVEMGQRLRIYTPFGDLMRGMAYFIRRLLENTANESFLRQSFSEHVPVELLLAPPGAPPRAAPPMASESSSELSFSPLLEGGEPSMASPSSPYMGEAAGGRFFVRGGASPDTSDLTTPFEPEPDIDFASTEARALMTAALREAARGKDRPVPAVIDGRPVTTNAWIEIRNPSRPADLVGRAALCTPDHADQAVQAAARALPAWTGEPPRHRARLLLDAATRLRQQRFSLAASLILEVGMTWREATAETAAAIDALEFNARELVQLLSKRPTRFVSGESIAEEPFGVVAAITASTFPLAAPAQLLAAALASGSAVVLKPGRAASCVAARLVAALTEAGAPAGIVGLVFGDASVAARLVTHPAAGMVALAGRYDSARLANRSALSWARDHGTPKWFSGHSAGRGAIIVDDDTNVDEAVLGTLASAFAFAGQAPTACPRVVVIGEAYSEFVQRLTAAVREISVGPADDPATNVGPLIDAEACDHAREIAAMAARSARCVIEHPHAARTADPRGLFFGPMVFADVPADAEVMTADVAAPILFVTQAANLSAALAIAQNGPGGSSRVLYSRSPAHIERVRSESRSVMLFVNRAAAGTIDPRTGRPAGPAYLREFLDVKARPAGDPSPPPFNAPDACAAAAH